MLESGAASQTSLKELDKKLGDKILILRKDKKIPVNSGSTRVDEPVSNNKLEVQSQGARSYVS